MVHLLPRDLARGAQVFARALRDRLDGPDTPQRTVTLFRSPAGALAPDHRLDVAPGRLRRLGFDLRVVPRLRRLLRDLAPSVVVAHGGEPLKYAALAVPAGTRLVAYKIGSRHESLRGGLQLAWHRRLLRRADRVVAISNDVADEAVAQFGCDPAQVVVIPNGRDPALYRPAAAVAGTGLADSRDDAQLSPTADARNRDVADGRDGRADQRFVIDGRSGVEAGAVRVAYVGHMEAPKRPLWFVELVRRIAAVHPQVRGLMAGEGPQFDEVRQAATDLPIEVLGRCDDVPALLATADVLVLPSQREGMPGVLVEAGMGGLPVVTTDVSGARDVVDDGVTGYVVPVDDLDRLVERTAGLVADPAERSVIGQAARRRCVEHFGVDAVVQAWSDLLADLGAGVAASRGGSS